MADKLHSYHGEGLDVTYDAARCIHFAACVRAIPRAFAPGSRPWVMPDNAPVDAVAKAVEACPTGALQYVRKDGGAAEAPVTTNMATVSRNGPTYLRGAIEVQGEGGARWPETRMALCRCGASKHKPYCDGSHVEVRFRDPGGVTPPPTAGATQVPEGQLLVERVPDGPVIVHGTLRIRDGAGAEVATIQDPTLCMCGNSRNKPFCDGSHLQAAAGG